MVKHLTSQQIDHDKWDKCIGSSFNGNVYALSWFLNFAHPNWEALVEDDYVSVMPLTVSKKYGLKYALQPCFVQQLGVYSTNKLFPEKVKEFIDAIPKNIKYVDINLNIHNKTSALEITTFENKTYMLDLVRDYESLRSNYSVNTKRNLKKASKHKLQLLKNIKPNELINLFKNNKGKELSVFNDANYQALERIIYRSIHKNMGLVYGVYDASNQLCAAAFFTRYREKLIFLFSGSNQKAKQNRAMFFLIDEVIKQHSPSLLTLDFEGSNDENLARFYAGFGSVEVYYNSIRANRAVFPLNRLINLYLKQNASTGDRMSVKSPRPA
ncbi:MAG: hypothetical protein GXO88_07425 [Chlorobi bacterium]|nr:hypothetical protein [Chlorobiota bacterium]